MNLVVIFLFFSLFLFSKDFEVIPQRVEYDKQKALLGKELFKDRSLSVDGSISCESCHNLQSGGDDGLIVSVGVNGKVGRLNAPTVFNAVFNFRQFWDGRAKTLEEQAIEPIENPTEMAHSFDILIKDLKPKYEQKFKKVYLDGITKKNIINAIVEFEKTLITPNSKFDKFLSNKVKLSKTEEEGFLLFKNKGCIYCHHGINLGGNQFNKFGLLESVESQHLGLYNVTKNEDDKYYFKVPTLRNVELTAPYFHDGKMNTLEDAVETMSMVQLGRPMTKDEIKKIVTFLKTLTGEVNIIK